jgi:hypothetical protein
MVRVSVFRRFFQYFWLIDRENVVSPNGQLYFVGVPTFFRWAFWRN